MFGKKSKMQEWKAAQEPPKETVAEPVPEMKQDSSTIETPSVPVETTPSVPKVEQPVVEEKVEENPQKVNIKNETISMADITLQMHSEYAQLALKWDRILASMGIVPQDVAKDGKEE